MTSFSDLDLDPKVLEAISEAGYTSPTPIQEQAIPHALVGRDVLGIAQTGTGKTASFTLPMITILAQGRAKARMPRSLILCPTRELAAQVAENFEIYGKHHRLSMALLIGGVSFKDQDKLIDRGVDVLIATPGRLLDHFERGKLMLTGVQIMVVDEADRMLDMGFIPDIERIFGLTPFTRQTLFFSATMAPEITRLTETFLHNPVRVEVARQATASATIEQSVCKHAPSRKDRSETEKREVLRRLMEAEGEELRNAIIFCNRKRDVDVLFKSLQKHGFNVGALHGDLDQAVRMRVLSGFRDGSIRFLVASDVAARGLDIPNVSHVFNFDVPIHSEDYVHRIGRTGRAGRKGRAITICLPHEAKYLAQIEDLVKAEIPVVESPLGGGEAEAFRPEATDRREKEGKPSRSRRGERKPRARKADREEAQATEPVTAEAATPEPEEAVAAPAPAPVPAKQEAEERSSEGRSSRGGRGGSSKGRGGKGGGREAPVIGLGDHVPAFLLREFKVKPSRSRSEAEQEEEDATA
ncbi:DEAD/DEAH box helicase [Oceanicella sp. SM1341]|uniref:DEAD/DEAH box helicase n=1 Tax=Oceanicella sp. SM1341 TaxID=1548889 RepID=UPI000E477BED|nr:DEAD/DEAH box helicase [Oceanicella sp. SM1341]